MGKQVRFMAERSIIETINIFAQSHGLKFILIQPSPDHDHWPVSEMAILDTTTLLEKSYFGIYRLVKRDFKLPKTKEEMVALMTDRACFIEVSLFMKAATGYDSRIWFQTPGHSLDEEANALLRKVRKVIKAQEKHALSMSHDSVVTPS